jgi:predicted RNA polymerase sigma factor
MKYILNLKLALDWIERIEGRAELTNYYLLPASQADVLRCLGRRRDAMKAYRAALGLVSNPAERPVSSEASRRVRRSCRLIQGRFNHVAVHDL